MYDELRHFLLIVEYGTFTEAARHAHLSQPALSASIRRLEDAMGARLLDRGRQGATPTAAGEVLLPRARAALAAIEEGRRAVAEVQGLHAGQVRLAGGATACTYLLPPELARFRQAHPGIRLHLRETTTARALELLAEGAIDLAIVSDPDGERWRVDQLILIGAPGLEAGHLPFVTFPPGATTRGLLEAHFPEAEVVMELAGLAAIKEHVRAGIGVALVSRYAVADDLASGRLVEVPDPRTPIRRTLDLVHRGAGRLSPAAAALRGQLLGG